MTTDTPLLGKDLDSVIDESIFDDQHFSRTCRKFIERKDAIIWMSESLIPYKIWGWITFEQKLRPARQIGWHKSPILFHDVSEAQMIDIETTMDDGCV